jgi:hypothetical protein
MVSVQSSNYPKSLDLSLNLDIKNQEDKTINEQLKFFEHSYYYHNELENGDIIKEDDINLLKAAFENYNDNAFIYE